MALKQVVLSRKLGGLQEQLRSIEAEAEELRKAREDWQRRSDEAEAAVNEVTEETSEEDVAAVEAAADKLVAEGDELEAKEADNENKRADLQEQIAQVENELNELNSRARDAAKQRSEKPGFSMEKKESVLSMETRKVMGLTYQERATLFGRDEVKDFLERARGWGRQNANGEKRAVQRGELLIPDVLLGIIRENVGEYSKLMKYINLRSVPGTSRMLVDGVTPEAVWTEQCGKLNELELNWSMVEMDGYKVGGYIPVCNALLEDATDPVSLGTEIMTKLTRSIGMAVDKAILYGTGTKMPLGIVTRLLQTEAPADQTPDMRPWEKLSVTHIKGYNLGTAADPVDFFSYVVAAMSETSNKYGSDGKFWAMNEKTKAMIVSKALSINAAGAVAAAVGDTMPVVGGAIETLDFVPDGDFVAGYGECYAVAERAGTSLGSSSEVRFIEDQTVFKATARYDGKPVIPEAFIAGNILGGTVTAGAVTFAEDKANA